MKRKLNNEEMTAFCSQMALILRSGISAFEGISMMLEDQEKSGGRELLAAIYGEMEQGKNLYEGIAATEMFPDYACRMVELGEVSGRLDEVMGELADYYTQEDALAQTIRRAVAYPLFMLIMMLGVLFVLMVKVMPVFQSVYQSLGTQMEGPAGAVLAMGQAMGRYSALFVGVFGIILLLFLWGFGTRRGRETVSRWMRKRSGSGSLSRQVERYRLAMGMGMCLRSGLDPERSLEMMEKLSQDEQTREKIMGCVEKMRQGIFFEEAVIEAELFEKMHNRMIRVGQRTGSLDQVMDQIADQCGKEASDQLWHRISMIEPTVVIVLAVLVGVILLSVMLPLMSMMAQIG